CLLCELLAFSLIPLVLPAPRARRNLPSFPTRRSSDLNAFNPAAAAGVMCRYTISIGWDGTLYDCDFNQMLDLSVSHGAPRHIRRSEEHTSELQSRFDLVCRLLLETKNRLLTAPPLSLC